MFMTDEEIRTSYRQAKDQEAQVTILADLNSTDRQAMEAKLRELGLACETRRKALPAVPPECPLSTRGVRWLCWVKACLIWRHRRCWG